MTDKQLTQTRIRAGVWEGVLSVPGIETPRIEAFHLERALPGVEVELLPGRESDYLVKVPIPSECLSEGVQTFLIRHEGETLAHFTIVTGLLLEDDLRAEIELLRAELDMLKRSFRQFATEGRG